MIRSRSELPDFRRYRPERKIRYPR